MSKIDFLSNETGDEWMVPVVVAPTPWAALRIAYGYIDREKPTRLVQRPMRPENENDPREWCDELWYFCEPDHPDAEPFWHGTYEETP